MTAARRAGAICVVLAAIPLAAACASAPESPAQVQADAAIANRVYVALNDDSYFFFRHVEVSVERGVVHLNGLVWTGDAIIRAQQIARAVPGVTGVVDRLELERPARTGGAG